VAAPLGFMASAGRQTLAGFPKSPLSGGGPQSPFRSPAGQTPKQRLQTIQQRNLRDVPFLESMGVKDPGGEDKPGLFLKILGTLDVPGTAVRSLVHNALSSDDVDMWDEVVKSFKGEDRISFSKTLKDVGVENEVALFIGGFIGDVLLDPTTYITAGTTSGAKSLATTSITEMVKHGVTREGLEKFGMNMADVAARYGDDLVEQLGKTALRSNELPPGLIREISVAARKTASEILGKGQGIKFFGQQIANVQPEIERFAYGAKDFLRTLPGAGPVEKAFNPKYVNVIRELGDEMFGIAEQDFRHALSSATNLNSQEAQKIAEAFLKFDDPVRQSVVYAMDDAMVPHRKHIGEMMDKIRTLLSKKNGILNSVDEQARLAIRSGKVGATADELASSRAIDLLGELDEVTAYSKQVQREIAKLQRASFTKARGFLPDTEMMQVSAKGAAKQVPGMTEKFVTPAGLTGRRTMTEGTHLAQMRKQLKGLLDNQRKVTGQLDSLAKESKEASSAIGKYRKLIDDLDFMKTKLDDYVLGTVMPGYDDAVRQALIRSGLSSVDAEEGTKAATAFREVMQNLLETQRAAGLEVPALYGEAAGALGYYPLKPSKELGIFEKLNVKRGIGAKARAMGSARDITEKRLGLLDIDKTVEELGHPGHRAIGRYGGKARPKAMGVRGFTPEGVKEMASDWLVKGQKPEIDVAVLAGNEAKRAFDNVAKTSYQRDVIEASGRILAKGEAIPAGWVLSPIRREGKTLRYVIPESVDDGYRALEAVFTNEESTVALLNTYDKLLNVWKRMATAWRPAFHGRNLVSNYVLAAMDDSAQVYGWKNAPKVMKALKSGSDELLDELVDVGGDIGQLKIRELIELSQQHRVMVGSFTKSEVWESAMDVARRATSKSKWLNPSYVGGEVGEIVEDGSRVAVFINNLRKGLDPVSAAKQVDVSLYNYSAEALTSFERDILRRGFPFMIWLRRNIPHMLNVLVHEPRKIAWLGHMQQAAGEAYPTDKSVMPKYMKDMMAIPTPFKSKKGERIMWNPNIPIQDLGKLDAVLGGEAGLRDVISSLSPMLKTPLELFVFKKDAYFDSDFTGRYVRAPGYFQRFEQLGSSVPAFGKVWDVMKSVMDLETKTEDGEQVVVMPDSSAKALRDASPALNDLAKFMDTRERTPQDRLSVTTGLKFMPFETEKFEEQAAYSERSEIDRQMSILRSLGIDTSAEARRPAMSFLGK